MKRKYPLWGEFLKARREAKYRSAREFCAKVPIGISYPQYSRYEAGEQLPSLEHALELCKHLEVQVVEGILEWNRAQLPLESEAVSKLDQLLSGVRTGGPLTALETAGRPIAPPSSTPASPAVRLDEVIVFNRSHLRMFGSDPAYRDIFTYINSYAPDWISSDEISRAMDIPSRKLSGMLDDLCEHGVIVMEGENCRASKRVFYFPDDADFFPMRNLNLVHNVSNIMRRLSFEDLNDRKAYRGLISRELTPAQLDLLISRLDGLLHDVVESPENGEPQKIYSLCVVLGERFDRAKVLPGALAQGLTTAIPRTQSQPSLDISEPRG